MKVSKITLRLALTFIVFGLALTTTILLVGYIQFSNIFTDTYAETLEAVSKTTQNIINGDHIKVFDEMGPEAEKNPDYIRTNSILKNLTEHFNLNFIFVCTIVDGNYAHNRYIFDTVNPDSGWTPYGCGYENYAEDEEFIQNVEIVYKTGKQSVSMVKNSKTGPHVTIISPVKDFKGDIVAVLGVEKNSHIYMDAINHYIRYSIIGSFLICLILILLVWHNSYRHISKPIQIISDETLRYKKEHEIKPGWNSSIKHKNETYYLAENISKMEKEINDAVETYTALSVEKKRISTELEIANTIQNSMLRQVYPPFPERKDFDLYATMIPAKEVGGDLYYYDLIDEDHLLMCVGDVSGKGVPAALFMAITKTLIATWAKHGDSITEIVSKTNWQLCQGNDLSMFVTMWIGIITLSTGELKFVNAAHPYPMIIHDGKVEYLKSKTNLMLGGMEKTKYQEYSVKLLPGDKIFIYTDGVTEAKGITNELYGDSRTLESFESAVRKTKNPKELVERIKSDIDLFVKGNPQFDDITMLAFESVKKE